MRDVETKYHGIIEIDESTIITFEEGIPGFPDQKKYVLLPLEQETPFMVLQSTSEAALAFIIINPFDFYQQYEVKLPDATIQKLAVEDPTQVAIYNILTVQSPFEKTTANLQAPLIVNLENKKAKQLILNDSAYKTKHLITAPLLKEES